MASIAEIDTAQPPALGESDTDYELTSRDDNRLAVALLLPQARRQIDIYTLDMDPMLYDRSEVSEVLTRFALNHRMARIRILTQDTQRAVKEGNRLIELCRRLSSYAEIRRVHEDYRDNPETFLLIDDYGLLSRKLATRFEGRLSFKSPLEVRRLRSHFDEVWSRSSPDPEFRRLHL